MYRLSTLALISLLLVAPAAPAREIEGVNVPESVIVADTPLVLNGAGVRSRFFVKVYVGALYLPARQSEAHPAITAKGAKSVRLHFLYKELEARKLTDAWSEGFKANHTEAQLRQLASRIDYFNGRFRDVRRGETIFIDLLPNGETQVVINNEQRGSVTGVDFQHALLKIWLGEQPADADLKRALLGE